MFPFGIAALFLNEVVRFLPALVDEKAAEAQVLLVLRHLVQADERHFRNFVAGIALALPIRRAEEIRNVIREPARRAQQLVLACCLIVADSALNQVTQAVQLVMITEALEHAVHAVDDVVGVKVAFGGLRGAHNVDGFISSGFQRLVGVLNQGIADGFNPLAEVSILKHEAVELVLIRVRGVIGKGIVAAVGVRLGRILRALLTVLRHDAPCQTEIMHTPAFFRAGDAVIERFPLVGNDFAADEFRFPLPERVSDGNGAEVDRVREAGGIHEGVLLYSRLIFSCWWWKPLVLNCSLRQLRGSALEGVARVV